MMPDVASRFATLGAEPVATTPEAFAALVRGQMASVKSVAERAKIEVQ
jgi:tripartite-type tricarboxylate transporter receptor subunit TctC